MIANTATTVRIAADKFARIRVALATQFAALVVGTEWLFMLVDGFDVEAMVLAEGTLTLRLLPVDEDGMTGLAVRTVTVAAGGSKSFEVIAGDGLVIGEAHGLHAAISIALDNLTLPVRAVVQHDHDVCGV